MRSVSLTSTLLLALALSGCKEDKPAAPAAKTSAAADPSSPAAKPAPDGEKRQRTRGDGVSARIGLEPITLDEVRPFIPVLTGAAETAPATATAGGRRIISQQCVDAEEFNKVKAELEAQLTKLGYTNLRSSSSARGDLMTMSGGRDPYRMSATLRMGPYPDCPADQKKVKVSMSFFKRVPRPAGLAPAGAPGATPTPPAAEPAKTPAK